MDTFVYTQLLAYKVPSCQTVKYTGIKVFPNNIPFWIYKSRFKISLSVLFHCCKLCNIPAGECAFWAHIHMADPKLTFIYIFV